MIHPSLDGCISLKRRHGLTGDDIESVELRVHPLVLELTGNKTPETGLQGKFSVYHAVGAAPSCSDEWASPSSPTRWCGTHGSRPCATASPRWWTITSGKPAPWSRYG